MKASQISPQQLQSCYQVCNPASASKLGRSYSATSLVPTESEYTAGIWRTQINRQTDRGTDGQTCLLGGWRSEKVWLLINDVQSLWKRVWRSEKMMHRIHLSPACTQFKRQLEIAFGSPIPVSWFSLFFSFLPFPSLPYPLPAMAGIPCLICQIVRHQYYVSAWTSELSQSFLLNLQRRLADEPGTRSWLLLLISQSN